MPTGAPPSAVLSCAPPPAAGDDKTLVNDYTLRITPREGERARANLRLTAAPGHLLTGHTTRFTATSDGWGAITWRIVEGGTAATINTHTGVVTAGATAETITVQASVAQTSTHSSRNRNHLPGDRRLREL